MADGQIGRWLINKESLLKSDELELLNRNSTAGLSSGGWRLLEGISQPVEPNQLLPSLLIEQLIEGVPLDERRSLLIIDEEGGDVGDPAVFRRNAPQLGDAVVEAAMTACRGEHAFCYCRHNNPINVRVGTTLAPVKLEQKLIAIIANIYKKVNTCDNDNR